MASLLSALLLLAMAAHSSATWCICKVGMSDSELQKTLDYACGNGADCNPIHQNGPCYNPNTVRAHCNYAVNSFFQKKGQAAGTCDFSSTASITTTDPSITGCAFPSSARVDEYGKPCRFLGFMSLGPLTVVFDDGHFVVMALNGSTTPVSTTPTTPSTGTPSTTTGNASPNPIITTPTTGGGFNNGLGPSGGVGTYNDMSHARNNNAIFPSITLLLISALAPLMWLQQEH
nr:PLASMODESMATA CALLOSE-BINDING PROTEIN 3-like isoform X2 [Ipomoea trifida]